MNNRKAIAFISAIAMMSTVTSLGTFMGASAEVTQIFNDTFVQVALRLKNSVQVKPTA